MLSLPNYKPVSVRNEVDRYGFSTLLANTLSLNHAPRSFCNWLHGWVWWDPEIADELGCSNLPFNVPIVVSKHSEQLLLNSLGYKNVHSGGLPFLIVKKIHYWHLYRIHQNLYLLAMFMMKTISIILSQ